MGISSQWTRGSYSDRWEAEEEVLKLFKHAVCGSLLAPQRLELLAVWKLSEAAQELDGPFLELSAGAEQVQELDLTHDRGGVNRSPVLSTLFRMAEEREPQGAAEMIKGNFKKYDVKN